MPPCSSALLFLHKRNADSFISKTFDVFKSDLRSDYIQKIHASTKYWIISRVACLTTSSLGLSMSSIPHFLLIHMVWLRFGLTWQQDTDPCLCAKFLLLQAHCTLAPPSPTHSWRRADVNELFGTRACPPVISTEVWLKEKPVLQLAQMFKAQHPQDGLLHPGSVWRELGGSRG